MTLSLFAHLILAFAALCWAETPGRRHQHSVVSVGAAKDHSVLTSLVNTRDTHDFQDVEDQVDDDRRRRRTYWKPTDAPFQIILSKVVLPSNNTEEDIEPSFASIFEVDLFDTPTSTFQALKRSGKKIICYFSAGTSEDWRPDYKEFTTADKGECDDGWAGERWLDVRSPGVWRIMRNRIRLAKRKGCDAIDPDNVDVSSNPSGKNLTQADAVTYVKKIAAEAHRLRLAFGLKNAQDLLNQVLNVTDFAVNEQCAQDDAGAQGCASYGNFTKLGRPVYHIEYTNYTTIPQTKDINLCSAIPALSNLTSQGVRDQLCLKGYENTIGKGFSTVIKNLGLDEFVLYCDGRWSKTSVGPKVANKAKFDCPVVAVPGAELQLPSPQGEGLCSTGRNSSIKVVGRYFD